MKEAITALKNHKSNKASRMLDAEAICEFIVSSSIDAGEEEEDEERSTGEWKDFNYMKQESQHQ